MKLHVTTDWQKRANVTAESGKYVGCAIGPGSEEGLVKVNGVLLQAGRVLPLQAREYKIERVNGVGTDAGDGAVTITSATRLELMMFECGSELAVEVARPNGQFGAKQVIVAGAGYYNTVLQIPVIGRRQTLFMLTDNNTQITGYRVTGTLISKLGSTGIVTLLSKRIVDVTFAATSAVAFYVGGMDNAENWHELVLDVQVAANTTLQIGAETIGEIGCR